MEAYSFIESNTISSLRSYNFDLCKLVKTLSINHIELIPLVNL